jgi:carboxylesterase type B
MNDNEGGIIPGQGAEGLGGMVSKIFGTYMGHLMSCGARDAARNRIAAGVNNVWRYRYFGTWPNQSVNPTAGAYHGSEIPMILGTTEIVTNVADTTDEKAVMKMMSKAWAEFAKDPVSGLAKLGWPRYDESSK